MSLPLPAPVATDEQAMWRVQAHDDPEAFAEIVGRWQGPIRNLCLRMTTDLHRAEDLAQETFSRLHARRREWQPTAKLSTYLWRIAINLCHDENRRRTRHGEVPLETLAVNTEDSLETAQRQIVQLASFTEPTQR
jgi:RNA polymerase sigma-70 factor, ECF subfamily